MSKPNTNPDALEQIQSTPEEAIPQVELNDSELETVAGGMGGEDISSGEICKVLEGLKNIRI